MNSYGVLPITFPGLKRHGSGLLHDYELDLNRLYRPLGRM